MKTLMIRRLTSLLLVLICSQSTSAQPDCVFLSRDFPAIADQLKRQTPWQVDQISQFVTEEVVSKPVQLTCDQKRKCFSIQHMGEVKVLESLVAKQKRPGSIDSDDWNQFLNLLTALSCEKISEEGKEFSCTDSKLMQFIEGCRKAASNAKIYDPSYVKLNARLGDVPENKGVCSDVVIRGLREVGIDLQHLVNKDRQSHPERYRGLQPGRVSIDRSIDHRRVTNLMEYFKADTIRFSTIIPPDKSWQPGDIVVWNLKGKSGFLAHIGVVSDERGSNGELLVIHHLPPSGQEDNSLHNWEIIGQFRLQ